MRVNGEPGELNTFVESRDVVEVDGERVAKQELGYVLLHKPAGVVTTASDPQGRPTVVSLVGHESRVVPVGQARRRHDGRAAADERRPARAPARASALRRREGLRGRDLEGADRRGAAAARRGRRARGRADVTRARPQARRRTLRARPPRGPEPPGAADVRRGRLPRPAAAPEHLRGSRRRRARAGRVAGALGRRGRGSSDVSGPPRS